MQLLLYVDNMSGNNNQSPLRHRTVSNMDEEMEIPGDISVNDASNGASDSAKLLSHQLPDSPKLIDYALFFPLLLVCYVKRLTGEFGWKFFLLVVAVYGINQGVGEEVGFFSSSYYMKDDLHLEPDQSQALSSIMLVPWTMKPVYGAMSDTFPIGAFHRGPYIFFSGLVGTASWLSLWLFPLGKVLGTVFLTLASASIASPDVMIDAQIAEHCQRRPLYAADLQTLCWGSMALGGLLSCSVVGYLQDKWHARAVFGLTSLTALVVTVPAALGWLGERKLPKRLAWKPKWDQLRSQWALIALAVLVAVCATFLGIFASLSKSEAVAGGCTVGVGFVVCAAVYVVLGRHSKAMAKAACYIFLMGAVQPTIGSAMFYWYTESDQGPQFTPEFIGAADCVANVAMLVGLVLYNRYMSGWRYRNIFGFAQVLLIGISFMDVILVMRWNLLVGIPDALFVLGEEAISPIVRKFVTMPMFILAAKVCIPGIEGTLFALLMSLSNFGGHLGRTFGVALIQGFSVTREDYSNLPWVLVLKTACRAVPLLLIYLLVPDASPTEDILEADLLKRQSEARSLDDEASLSGSISHSGSPTVLDPGHSIDTRSLLSDENTSGRYEMVDINPDGKTDTMS